MSFGENINQLIECSENPHLQIHPSWERVRLGDIADILNGAPWKSQYFNSTDGVPVIRIRDVTSGATNTRYNGPTNDGPWVEPGDLLVGMDGDFNVRRWKSHKGLLNQRVCKISISKSLYSSRFIEYILPSYLAVINQATSSVTVKHLSSRTLNDLPIPLPPLTEQRRIVAKLDSLTTRIARARAELERVPVLIARYKKILLKRAFTGELTNKWRLMNGISEIEMTPLSDVCTSITDGDHQAPPRAKYGVPFITISAMNDGKIDLSKATRFVPSSYLDALKDSRKAKTGDVLFSVTGSIGIPALVKHECPFVFQRHIAILKPDTGRVSGLFLKLMLQSPDVQAQCAAVATGTAQLTVPLNRLRNFLIPLPTIAEQIEVIRLVESTCKRLERMHEDYVDADHLLSKLESSLLAKAFRGELVPQDPDDEPASVLLDRIQAERAAAPKPKRGRKQSTQDMPVPRKRQTEKHG